MKYYYKIIKNVRKRIKNISLVSLALFILMSTYGVHNVANLRKQKDCLANEQ